MKTVAYLRVSTGSQDLATQKLAILDFTQKRRFTVDAFIESRISSRKSPIERRIEEMLGTLQSGDRLLVSELSRLGPQPLSGYWARKSRRPQLPRSWTSPVPPSTTSSRRARSGQADEKARLGQPRPYVVFQHQSGRYPNEEDQLWFERIGEKRRAAVIAQLALGMGIALSVKELKAFLDTKAS